MMSIAPEGEEITLAKVCEKLKEIQRYLTVFLYVVSYPTRFKTFFKTGYMQSLVWVVMSTVSIEPVSTAAVISITSNANFQKEDLIKKYLSKWQKIKQITCKKTMEQLIRILLLNYS